MVEVVDAEVVTALTKTQARALTKTIQTKIGEVWELVVQAWEGRVWDALGYSDWTAYVEAEFGEAPLSVPREKRQAVTVPMAKRGMSTRAIAAAVGVSKDTVQRDVSTVSNETDDQDRKVVSLDGRERPAKKKAPLVETFECDWCGLEKPYAERTEMEEGRFACNECVEEAEAVDVEELEEIGDASFIDPFKELLNPAAFEQLNDKELSEVAKLLRYMLNWIEANKK